MQERIQPQFAVPVSEYASSPQFQNFHVIDPPNVLPQPETSHSQPRYNRNSSHNQAKVVDANTRRAIGGSSK